MRLIRSISFSILPLGLLVSCGLNGNNSASYQVAAKTALLTSNNSPTEFRIAMGTRWMVSSTLEDIFGANTNSSGSVKVKDVTADFVLNQITSWGGPCDPYANSHPVPHLNAHSNGVDMVIESPSARGCPSAVYSQAAILPSGSTSRLAWTIRTCDKIVSSDDAVRNAASQAGLPTNALLTTAPSEDFIRSAFDIFHPGIPLTANAASALRAVVDEASKQYPNSIESWRFLLLTLCSSPGWQML